MVFGCHRSLLEVKAESRVGVSSPSGAVEGGVRGATERWESSAAQLEIPHESELRVVQTAKKLPLPVLKQGNRKSQTKRRARGQLVGFETSIRS
jgi:hypothetical protein